MKFATTLATIALINNVSAFKLQKAYADDLFTDDYEQQSLMESLTAAEKSTGKTMSSQPKMSGEDFRELITQKTQIKFDENDQFVKDGPASFAKLQLDAEIKIDSEEARPIGEFFTQIDVNTVEDGNVISSNGMLRAASSDQKVLAGAQLNDDDDQEATLESLKSAERMSGTKLGQVEFTEKNFAKSGNLAKDFMAEDTRIYTSYLKDALTDKDAEEKKVKAEQDAIKASEAAKKKKEVKVVQEANEELNFHFREDDLMAQIGSGVRFVDDADSIVEHASDSQ